MSIQVITTADAVRVAVGQLGLATQGGELSSIAGLAASLRRAASVLCPATPRQLVDSVMDAVSPLIPAVSLLRNQLDDLVDALVAYGDLLELADESGRRLLYLGPPTYVEQTSGRYLLCGIKPYGEPLFDDDLARQIEYSQHRRSIELEPGSAQSILASYQLHEVKRGTWAKIPDTVVPADQYIQDYTDMLQTSGVSGLISGLTLVDPRKPTRYYRGRWRELKIGDSGNFVARRPQAFGADRWCFVQLADGHPRRLLDLPIDQTEFAHDEAWRLMAARDAALGQPQTYRLTSAEQPGDVTLSVFSPLPSWAQKYLELIGTQIDHARGALLTYQMTESAAHDGQALLQTTLWMVPLRREDDK